MFFKSSSKMKYTNRFGGTVWPPIDVRTMVSLKASIEDAEKEEEEEEEAFVYNMVAPQTSDPKDEDASFTLVVSKRYKKDQRKFKNKTRKLASKITPTIDPVVVPNWEPVKVAKKHWENEQEQEKEPPSPQGSRASTQDHSSGAYKSYTQVYVETLPVKKNSKINNGSIIQPFCSTMTSTAVTTVNPFEMKEIAHVLDKIMVLKYEMQQTIQAMSVSLKNACPNCKIRSNCFDYIKDSQEVRHNSSQLLQEQHTDLTMSLQTINALKAAYTSPVPNAGPRSNSDSPQDKELDGNVNQRNGIEGGIQVLGTKSVTQVSNSDILRTRIRQINSDHHDDVINPRLQTKSDIKVNNSDILQR